MKKIVCLLSVLGLLMCSCAQNNHATENSVFTQNENGNLISASGVEYAYLAIEGSLCYFGELQFAGSIEGEETSSQHLGLSYQTGMFAIKNNDNILIRRTPDSEWFSIYRKSALPVFDFSADNCIRLEFVSGIGNSKADIIHTTCNGGIADKSEIAAFLSEIRQQDNPRDAGFYDMIRKPDGQLENCYVYGVVYGFFADEPNLAIQMVITSYNDLAYSVLIGANEYVLPEVWLQKLLDSKCTP